MSTRLTRAELYQFVWSEPLRKLSKRFGISDVALAKRCRAANIPLPGLGYWTKKEALVRSAGRRASARRSAAGMWQIVDAFW